MAGILDFFSPESGQRRRAALDQLGRSAEYYVPPELRQLLGFAAEMTPTATIDRAAEAGGRMMAPDRTPMQRVGDFGGMMSETAGVAAPMAVAGRAGMPVAQAVQEGLLGFSMGADDVGRKFVERMNQPGPVPTMYSNPLVGTPPTTSRSLNPAEKMQMAKDILDLRSAGRAGLDQMRDAARLRREARAQMLEDLTQDASPVRMKSGDLSVLVSKSPDRDGWRVTYFQPDGSPSGHVDTKDKSGAVQRALEDQFTPVSAPAPTPPARALNPAEQPAGSLGPGGRDSTFGKGWADAYHWTRSPEPFDQFDPDKSTSAMSQLGPHVGTRSAAQARTLAFPNEPGTLMSLKANTEKPFLNPRTNEPWSEIGLESFISAFADEQGIDRRNAAPVLRRMLADEGYTDVPYINDIEDAGSISNIMLVDRPSDADAVLRRRDAAFDPEFRHLRNLSAGVGGLGLLSAIPPQEEQY